MAIIVGVRFKRAGKVYYFNPGQLELAYGDMVIVETIKGIEAGCVVIAPRDVPEETLVAPLKDVVRKITPKDEEIIVKNKQKEKEAFDICFKKIKLHNLDMHLLDVEVTFDVSKIIFYFTAEGRVDFRELVKDLAAVFRTRIELRQIGVRDEAKMLGGLGVCGRGLCCSTHLGDFEPVSIKMAKDQGLSLNPSKISGACGRLMCCLNYEQNAYEQLLDHVPPVGTLVKTPSGKGTVVFNSLLKETVGVKLELHNESTIQSFKSKDVKPIGKPSRTAPPKSE